MLKVAAFIASRSFQCVGHKNKMSVNLIGQNDNSVTVVTEKIETADARR